MRWGNRYGLVLITGVRKRNRYGLVSNFEVRKRNRYGSIYKSPRRVRGRVRVHFENGVRVRIPYPSTHSGVWVKVTMLGYLPTSKTTRFTVV